MCDPFLQFLLDLDDGPLHLVPRRDEVTRRKNNHPLHLLQDIPGQRIYPLKPFNLIPEKFNPDPVLPVSGPEFDHIPAHPEFSPLQLEVVPLILNLDQLGQQLITRYRLPDVQSHQHLLVIIR